MHASAVPVVEAPPFHTGYAPNPPASTLAPFTFDTADPAGPVTAADAVTVPALSRALAIVAGVVAAFPLDEWRNGARVTPRRPLLTTPDLATTRQVTITRTVEDLALYGVGWWLVTDRDPATGKPRHARHVDAGTVEVDAVGRLVDTDTSRPYAARDLIRFDHDRYGILHRAGTILRTAVALERAAQRYAANPAPRTILASDGDVILTPAEQSALVDQYESTIRRRSTAYVQNVKPEQVGWSSSELQLTEARQYTAAQVSLACNLDPIWCGANQPGSSLTYTNRQDLYRALIDVTLRPYVATIEQRLSADDVTERGRVVRFDMDGFLRGNATERADLAIRLRDAGLLDDDTARRIVDLQPADEVTAP